MGLSKFKCCKTILNLRINCGGVFSRAYSETTSSDQDCPKLDSGNVGDKGEGGTKKGLVLGVYEEKGKFELTPAAEEVNQKSEGKLSRYLNELSGELKLGKAFALTDVVPDYSVVTLASYGPKDAGYNAQEDLDEARENVRWGVGAGVREARARGCGAVSVDGAGEPDAAAEAAHLAAWSFSEFKTGKRHPETELSLYGTEESEPWAQGSVLGRAQNWGRYLSDMPANKMTPMDMAQAALDVLCPLGVRVSVRERGWLRAQRMAGVLGVARGACEPPALLDCAYRGGDGSPVLLAAKGVTFDSGGLCLKPATEMGGRGSVAGAAVVLAVLRALAELKVGINVCAVLPLCENMVSGHSLRPGDVLAALNGLSVQVEDTDLEGRLLLADALVYGQAQYRPGLVVDVAALTPGAAAATGGAACGAFSNSERAWAALRRAAAASGERAWRLPLWRCYGAQLADDPSVDLRNKGSGTASACLGAAFLRHFVCGEWLHLDIAGVCAAGRHAPPYLRARRATARPARALAALLRDAAAAPPAGRPAPAPAGRSRHPM